MEGRNILDQFSVFQFSKETVNIPVQKRQMFETEGLVSQFSTSLHTCLSVPGSPVFMLASVSTQTSISQQPSVSTSLSPPITELLQDGMVCTEVDKSQGGRYPMHD